jgi:hypothetical protein
MMPPNESNQLLLLCVSNYAGSAPSHLILPAEDVLVLETEEVDARDEARFGGLAAEAVGPPPVGSKEPFQTPVEFEGPF